MKNPIADPIKPSGSDKKDKLQDSLEVSRQPRPRRPYQLCGNTLKQQKRDELERWRKAILCHLSGEFATQLLYTDLKRGQRALVLKAFNEASAKISHMSPDAFDYDEVSG